MIDQYDKNGKCSLNCDIDNNGWPETNLDLNADGVADINLYVDDYKVPKLNIDTTGNGQANLNVDTNGDLKADINVDIDNDGKPDINIDVNGDLKADINVDTDNDGIADLNLTNQLDNNGNCKLNCYINNNGKGLPEYNIDIDGDGKYDINIDLDGDKIPDANIDTDLDGIIDSSKIDTSILFKTTEENTKVKLSMQNIKISYLDNVDFSKDKIVIGWTKTKKFTITNDSNQDMTYDINWNDIINNFGWGNRPNYELSIDGNKLVNLTSQLPYAVNNGEKIVKNIQIKANTEQEVVLNYAYTPENNYDDGKLFYAILEIKPNEN